MITRIYRRSYGVHIWLRGEGKDLDIAINLVKKITLFKIVRLGEKEIVV